ncbi:MAG: hypothetical protein R3185_04515, partial [Candidatus Thermoplasmatota archaeon]|nr:hypothetical protein [Candidatus Thermoplasmatota archaeon]
GMTTGSNSVALGAVLILLISGCVAPNESEPTQVYQAEAYAVPEDALAQHGYEAVASTSFQIPASDLSGPDAGSFALRGYLEHYERTDPHGGNTSTFTVFSLPDVDGGGNTVVDPFIYTPVHKVLQSADVQALSMPPVYRFDGKVAMVPIAVDDLVMPVTGDVAGIGDVPSDQNDTRAGDGPTAEAAPRDAGPSRGPAEFESALVLPLSWFEELTADVPGPEHSTYAGSDFGHVVVVEGVRATYVVGNDDHVVADDGTSNQTSADEDPEDDVSDEGHPNSTDTDGSDEWVISATIGSREVDLSSKHGELMIAHVGRASATAGDWYVLAVHPAQQPDEYFRSLGLASMVHPASPDAGSSGEAVATE